MRRLGAFILVLLALAFILQRSRNASQTSAPIDTGRSAPVTTPVSTPADDAGSALAPPVRVNHSDVGFRSPERLAEHFAKHGAEFGGFSKAQYLAAAQRLRDATAGGDVLEIVRASDGVVSRFDKASGAFLAYDPDGTIRTFFKPNDGEAYFRRQAKRRPTP